VIEKRRQGAWAMLLALLAWWHTSPAWAMEGFGNVGLSETSPPAIVTQLNQVAATAPQVYILSPRSEEVVTNTDVAVKLQVFGTPIFKNAALGIGPHLHLLLDRVPTQSVYDLNSPIILSNLTPGTHTLQVLANKPWHESWKNPEAFTQVTFHVLAKSTDSPNPRATQLISVQPIEFGAEPWLLDFYLANAPSHSDPQHPLRQVNDWRVRTTINDQSFEVNRGQPIYLRGLRPGVNVLKLEYLNAQGQVADSAIRVVRYQPNGTDGLSRLLRNELSIEQALAVFDPQSRAVAVVPVVQPIAPPAQLVAPNIIPNPVMPVNPVIPANPTMPANPVMSTNPTMPANPVMSTNPTMPANPVMPVNPTMPANPVMPVNPTMPANPVMPANPAMPTNPMMPANPVMPANPMMPMNPTMPANPTMPTQSWNRQPENASIPTIPAPAPTVAIERREISPPPQTPVNYQPPALPSPSQPIVQHSLGAIAALPTSPVTNKVPTEKSPSIPSPTNSLASQPPALVTKPLVPKNGEEIVEFQVIWREFWHTTSVEVKRFTNQIPPLVSTWSENFGHWLSDRFVAMRPQPSPDPANSVRE
jgi:hypothetical protein